MAVNDGDARYLVLLIVLVFVPALDELLFCFLQTKWTNESLAFIRDVDVCHIAWLVASVLALHLYGNGGLI